MKTMRKLVSLLAILGMLLTLWAPVAVSAAEAIPAVQAVAQQEESAYFGRSILGKMDNSAALLYAYDKLVEGCETVSDRIDISHSTYSVNYDEASLVYRIVMADHPEFFWLTDGLSMSGTATSIKAFVLYVHDGIDALRTKLDARVAELTADLAGKSDYEKSLILHDRVADAVVYQYSSNDQTVVGSLLEGKSVCAGYARAYQLLLQKLGIPCFYVTGHSKGQAHAWNLVQLDGEWYYTDVTWDDQNDNGGYLFYAYLNTTFDQMEEDHTAVDFAEYLPRATATAANYHVKNGSAMASPDAAKIAALIKANGIARMYVTGDMQTFIDQLGTVMGDVVYKIAGGYFGYSYGMSYLGRELILNLEITHTHQYETVTVAATCTTDGSVTIRCKTCGVIDSTQTLPATGHTAVVDPAVAPTCIAVGLTAGSHCGACGVVLTPQTAIPALEHNAVADSGYAPTCTQQGLTDGSHCDTCGVVLTPQTVIPALGHNAVADSGYAPTCTQQGLTDGSHCDTCGAVLTPQTVIPALEHNAVTDSGYAPTCTQQGLTDGSHCDTCGAVLTPQTAIPALGHNAVADSGYAPTCTQQGLTDGSHCDTCGAVLTPQTVIPALGHNAVADSGYAPTCTQQGLTDGSHCDTCGVVLTPQTAIPALGHEWSADWEQSAEGHQHHCSRCSATEGFKAHVYTDDHDSDCNVCGYERATLPVLSGDANGDGKVNNRDLGILQQYLNGYDVTVDATAADLNHDGRINNRDLGMLQQQLNS